MSYQVIARKYRPQTFEEVVGQKPIVTTLRNAIEQQRIHHAYLFSGPRGIGKTTVARLLAKSLNCAQGPTPKPCNECASCREVAQSRSMDVLEIDGASNRGIENVRELRETVRYAPARDRRKIFIVDEVHMLTDPAWNALLKTLEEPPPQVVFVFATTEYREIPLTILSRCQHFEFRKIPAAEILAHLRAVAEGEGVRVEPSALDLICRASEGSLRDALSALDQVIAFSGNEVTDEMARTILGVIDRELIAGFYAAVKARDCTRLVGIVDTVFEKGYQPVDFLEDLMAHGRDLLLARTVAEPQRYLSGTPEEIRALDESASVFGEDELLRLLELMTREIPRVKGSSHPRFLLEALGIKLARLGDLQPIEELIARLESDGGAAPSTPGPSSGTRPAPAPQGGTRLSPQPGRPTTPAPRPGAAEVQAPPVPGASAPTTPPPTPVATSPVEPAPATPASQEPVESMLRKVHAERAAIGGILGQAVWIQLSDGVLKIAFSDKQSFFKEKVQSREVSDYLRRVAGEIAGRDVRVQVDVATPGSFGVSAGVSAGVSIGAAAGVSAVAAAGASTGAAAEVARPILPASDGPIPPAGGSGRPGAERRPAIDEAARRALVDQAMQEPTVRSLLDVLGGEIVDIEPA